MLSVSVVLEERDRVLEDRLAGDLQEFAWERRARLGSQARQIVERQMLLRERVNALWTHAAGGCHDFPRLTR